MRLPERVTGLWTQIRRADVRALVGVIVALALVVRLVDLGTRMAHWDEARVAYWTLRTVETSAWAYRPIIHGPLLQHVGGVLFEVVEPTDFVIRLPVAVVGGLLPAVALLVRSRLDRREVLALAMVLAADPVLVYYGRFFRSDVPLAAFALLALGAAIRAIDTDDARWWPVVGLAAGLALATKENAILYPVAWAGAVVVTVALAHPAIDRADTDLGRARDGIATVVDHARRGWPWLVGGLALAVGVVVITYAPRTAGPTGGIEDLLAHPASLGAILDAVLVDAPTDLIDLWVTGDVRGHSVPLYLGYGVAVLVAGSLGTVLAAAVGAARDRRPLVVFATVWGVASVVGYAVAADVRAPWLAVHAIVALAIPAAVGLAKLSERVSDRVRKATVSGWPELPDRTTGIDRRSTLAVALLTVIAVHTAVVGGVLAYQHPEPRLNFIAQGAQPGENAKPTLDRVASVSVDGPEVAWVGGYAVRDERATLTAPPPSAWFERLPLPWYVERAGLEQISVADPADLDDPPPVVIGPAADRDRFAPLLDGYEVTTFARFRHGSPHTYRVGPWSYTVEGESAVIWMDRDVG
ncbi:flippase activity-associated protein Agl23 [Halococcoides cellulosivorans]|uniref:flippase activity-associated protein Agl23 n=1 Tax=Halococcoides cellulosivorans TaxID=1679096 RepID=UPI00131EF120|nr:flippase activity-associated protein Agl23 [Halococcoides cellulosivorans]